MIYHYSICSYNIKEKLKFISVYYQDNPYLVEGLCRDLYRLRHELIIVRQPLKTENHWIAASSQHENLHPTKCETIMQKWY